MLDRAGRDGLRSWTLFFRDLVPALLTVFVRTGGLMGDESREASGDCVAELLADDRLAG
jgi:hypothetical protein